MISAQDTQYFQRSLELYDKLPPKIRDFIKQSYYGATLGMIEGAQEDLDKGTPVDVVLERLMTTQKIVSREQTGNFQYDMHDAKQREARRLRERRKRLYGL